MKLETAPSAPVASRWNRSARLLPIATAALAAGTFIVDTVDPNDISFPLAYIVIVLLASRFCYGRDLVLVAAGCIALLVLSYLISPPIGPTQDALMRMSIRSIVIAVTAYLVLQSQSAQAGEREKAALLDLTKDTIFIRNMDDVITYWNRGAAELYGWSAEEAIGRVTHDLLRTRFPAPLTAINAELHSLGRWDGELVHTKRDGSELAVASRWALQRDRQGNAASILETNNDITERKRSEDALQLAQAELAHVARMSTLGELAASIAHEINQPLAAIVNGAGAGLRWLDRQPPDLDEARQMLARILKDGNRAAEVIGRIRALVSKSPVKMDRLSFNDIVLDVIALARGDIERNRVVVRTQLADDLPPILGDRVQLRQVLLNLVTNAIEAMHDHDPRELVITSGNDEAQNVVVSVRDSGPGLDPETVNRIFQSFFTTKTEGMGMGLSICRSIVEAHGGQLSARANEPHGARFEVALPREEAQTSTAQLRATQPR
ncbi:PAS domain-containing sensor histidine kinase [Mesorhizobium sp. M1E.F.Ca.ET.063.01.1.1]|uniref:sensor histidine kinase n=1 Tax=Mesorhizobium sp. M1E.F.Ca.ET.063.01.1.1 TaxID=2496750 RepID=UPI000FCBC356|nr:PAS domain-containing sensor histidine kinase [Mesorhizobium sp. M1E.F.Ca.ET.063.01.1.1]RUW86117.1 PAS domain-containing sensor histidine kinase [Mesorhizobium sp. M1E.F.Ca.ET.063.01.1.1]